MSDLATEALNTNLSVPEIPPANTPIVEDVNITSPINAADELGLALPGIQGPKEALGSDSSEELARMEAHMKGESGERQRGPDGKFLPADGKQPADAKPAAAKPATAKPVAAKPVATPKAVTQPPVAPAKIKIGDEEKTADEWKAHFDELKNPKSAAAKPEAAKPEAPKEPTDAEKQQQEQQLKEKRIAFITKQGETFNPADYGLDVTPEQWDQVLVGGPEAVKALMGIIGKTIAASHAISREWTGETVGRVLDQRDEALAPILKQHEAIKEYQRDQDFLGANPEIKAHATGLETARNVRREMHDYYDTIQQKLATGTATADEILHAQVYEKATPEQFEASVAQYTRQRLGLQPGQVPAAPAATKPATPPPVAKPAAPSKPFNGDAPGGGSTIPSQESDQARQLREMREYSSR